MSLLSMYQIEVEPPCVVEAVASDLTIIRPDVIRLQLSAAAKFVDLIDGKVEGSRPDNKIQSSRSSRSAPIDKG
jgi:hypothetical protein